MELSNYAREVFFYADLSRTVDIQAPRCFAAEFDPDTHDFVLLMEDLAPGVQIDQMSECSTEQAPSLSRNSRSCTAALGRCATGRPAAVDPLASP